MYYCSGNRQQPILTGNPLVAVPSAWPKHDKAKGRDYFLRSAADKPLLVRLPSDFYIHQLTKKAGSLLKRDTRTLASFCGRWGAMEHPLRHVGLHIEGGIPVGVPGVLKLIGGKVEGATPFGCFEPEHLLAVAAAIARTEEVRRDTGDGSAVSVAECRMAIRDMAEAVFFMNSLILGEEDWLTGEDGVPEHAVSPLFLIDCGLSNEYEVAHRAVFARGHREINLTNAVCNQILASIMEPEEWRICPQCGTPYKHYQKDSRDFGERKTKTKSAYCSMQCTGDASRRARGKPRHRIQH